MAEYGHYRIVLLLIYCLTRTLGHEDLRAVLNQLKLQEEDINQIKLELPRFETRVINKMGLAELSLRADLVEDIVPGYVLAQVEKALSRILSNESLDAMVNSEIQTRVTEMEKQIQEMSRNLSRAEENRNMQIQFLQKCEAHVDKLYEELNRTGIRLSRSEENLKSLKSNTTKLRDRFNGFRKKLGRKTDSIKSILNQFNETHLRDIERIRTDVARNQRSNEEQLANYKAIGENVTSISYRMVQFEEATSKLSKNLVLMVNKTHMQLNEITLACGCGNDSVLPLSTTTTEPSTMASTTPEVDERMTRILVIQRHSGNVQTPFQIDLEKNNHLTLHRQLYASHVRSAMYDPINRRIIFSRYFPAGVFYSMLDVSGLETLKPDVIAYGMDIDVDRRFIFMGTFSPRYKICVMTTEGKNFRVVSALPGYKEWPRGIAVDSRQQVIYFCSLDRLSAVDYDGGNLRTLESESKNVHAVVFDPVRNNLIFNLDNKVVMKSLATGDTTDITEYHKLWKMILYGNKLYMSSCDGGTIDVFDLENHFLSNMKKLSHRDHDIIMLP